VILLPLAFLAGILTILSPCVLPIIPLVVGTTLTGRTVQVVAILVGFALSFVLATVALASMLAAMGVTTSGVRLVAIVVLGLAGATIAMPALASRVSRLASLGSPVGARVIGSAPADAGLVRGLVLGSMIGLLWAPCVGPLMAAVIASALVVGPTVEGAAVALAYVAGTAAALGLVAFGGRRAIRMVRPAWSEGVRRAAGLAMVVTAALVLLGVDQTLAAALPSIVDPAAVEGAASGSGTATDPAEEVPVDAADALPDLGPAPELTGITDWINSPPLSLASLRGKVVLVHFWTFGCINCQHVQPYVKAWADKYAGDGLVVVGVHTPELSFERDIANVREAVTDDGVRFPVAFDPAYSTWNAYGNRYWPAFYFVDRDGRIRHTHFGEGDYDGSEAVIRSLLAAPGTASR
jgi:cytochrome c biogenesis protein CcdA/thiol-disulfide isomerase/thioredoxin